jgi:hypothetical protein
MCMSLTMDKRVLDGFRAQVSCGTASTKCLSKMVGSAGLLAPLLLKTQQNWQNLGFDQCLRRVALNCNLSHSKPTLALIQGNFSEKCIPNVSRPGTTANVAA